MNLHRKNVLITGGHGFLGSHVINLLKQENLNYLSCPRSKDYDLRNFDDCLGLTYCTDIVIHLAAKVGGIGFNQNNPASLFYDNAMMGINLIEASRRNGIKKIVVVGSVCAYPKFTPTPFKESDLWSGYPEETNAPYGIAKKMLSVQLSAYKAQYNLNGVYLLPVNLYGPRDNFDENSSHVIPALIKKFVNAKRKNEPTVSIWGSGTPTREFLYVEDAAEAIVLATKNLNTDQPINLGTGKDISILDLSKKISSIVGYSGEIVWDKSKPDGQPKRQLDVSLAKELLGWSAKVNLDTGLKSTIEWFEKCLT